MRYAVLGLLLLMPPSTAADLGLKVPPGFRVTEWADHTLANDIFTMALDEKGRVVVSGPGYVRLLEDTDGDGKADKATDIAPKKTGLQGLCYHFHVSHPPGARHAILSGDGRLRSHLTGPEGAVESTAPLVDGWKFGEHGGHAVKFGPDGLVYAVAGNDTGLAGLKLAPSSPVRSPEAGGILRFSGSSGLVREVVAHGFRNPYDFDFTPYGDLITFDSDTERDYLLPWYSPTRVYHVQPGGHHGWRLSGYQRSLARPNYYADTVDILADLGRGSPTGVCCYRHTQFPEHYRGGVFLLDWTFGRVHYLPLIPEGSSYKQVKPEVFLEPTGTNGFAPTAIRVAPDGSLFISIGGRGTRGAVYKVEYRLNGDAAVIPPGDPPNFLDRVLDAPQPLEAWSAARWLPLTLDLEAVAIEKVALDERQPAVRRIRAIDVLVRHKGGVYSSVAAGLMESGSPLVRARLAWALGVSNPSTAAPRLWQLAADPHPRVRVAALHALLNRAVADPNGPHLDADVLSRCLADDDRRVRLAAAHLVARIVTHRGVRRELNPWRSPNSPLWKNASVRARVSLIIGFVESGDKDLFSEAGLTGAAWSALEAAGTPADRLDALRAVLLVLGDWDLSGRRVELFSAYAPGSSAPGGNAYLRLVSRPGLRRLLDQLPFDDDRLNVETARLLAVLESDDAAAAPKLLARITEASHPTHDFHYLTVLTRLTGSRDDAQTRQVADALLGMERKLAGRQLRIKQNWSARFAELVGELLTVYPGLDKVLAAHAALVQPGHVTVAGRLTGTTRTEAARRFLAVVKADDEFLLTPELIDLMAGLTPAESRPVLRARWADRSLREAIVHRLADGPDPADRGRFLEVLEAASADAARQCVSALATLPRDDSPTNLVPLLARLRQSFSDPKEGRLRQAIVALINRQSGQSWRVLEGTTDAASLASAYRPVFAWFEKAHPTQAKRLNAAGEDEAVLRAILPAVKWEAGDAERGRKLYRDRGCQTCHGGSARLGPDLAGVVKRFSRDDLLTAILNPSRDVAPVYRVNNVDTKAGQRVTGIVVFEAADGIIIQTSAVETRRIAAEDIESRTPGPKSLMPDGLLKGLRPEDTADLFAFLATQ